ncbi:MAG: homoserine dehydrogenase [Anaerolineales bacterium]
MNHYKLAFLGFGNVGRALAQLLERKTNELKQRYSITYAITGIATRSHGIAIDPAGLDLTTVLHMLRTGSPLSSLSKVPVNNALEFIQKCGADVLFENTPVNHVDGQPAVEHCRVALEQGMHVATANKGTVVYAYQQLIDLGRAKGRKFYHESTVMDGAPIFSLFRGALPAAKLLGFKGILNSTTNLILTRMEEGHSFEQAVAYAQQIGLAETDPSADVDGWDAAIKVAALVTVLMGTQFTPQQVEREGIRGITADMVARAKTHGMRYKLICSAQREAESIRARVAPELVPADSPFYNIEGSTSIIQFKTDVLGELSITEADPGPATTAYGLLADFINMVTGW